MKNLIYGYSKGTPFEKGALKGVSVDFNEGEIVAIIGHTGSGKSTLLQHLNGLLKADSGDILYYDARNGVSILWAAVRVEGDNASSFPIGFTINAHNGYDLNETYPEFFIDSFDPKGSHMTQHFKSLLRFQADQATQDRGPVFRNAAGEYSAYVLDYVEEYGVNTYACLVSATPQGLQAMLEDGTASHIILMDGWIDVG